MFKEIDIRDIKENSVELLNDKWGLVTAGNKDAFNTMTVSWGAMGELWGKDMVTIYIRPQRYTREFIEKEDYFSLSFYPDEYKDDLKICGRISGRDENKLQKCSLTPTFNYDAPAFEQANIVLICKKVARGEFKPDDFIDKSIMDNYASNDFHYIYYGAIEKVLISE